MMELQNCRSRRCRSGPLRRKLGLHFRLNFLNQLNLYIQSFLPCVATLVPASRATKSEAKYNLYKACPEVAGLLAELRVDESAWRVP